jgi:cytochrome c-type biogenesis protein
MPSGGWQTDLSAWLQHVSSVALQSLSWVPGWAVLAVFLGALGLLLRRALRISKTPASISNRNERENQSEILVATDTVEGNQRDQGQR